MAPAMIPFLEMQYCAVTVLTRIRQRRGSPGPPSCTPCVVSARCHDVGVSTYISQVSDPGTQVFGVVFLDLVSGRIHGGPARDRRPLSGRGDEPQVHVVVEFEVIRLARFAASKEDEIEAVGLLLMVRVIELQSEEPEPFQPLPCIEMRGARNWEHAWSSNRTDVARRSWRDPPLGS